MPRKHQGVVDAKLKVYGTTNLRIADLSIVPLNIAAHPQGEYTYIIIMIYTANVDCVAATAYVIGEKGMFNCVVCYLLRPYSTNHAYVQWLTLSPENHGFELFIRG